MGHPLIKGDTLFEDMKDLEQLPEFQIGNILQPYEVSEAILIFISNIRACIPENQSCSIYYISGRSFILTMSVVLKELELNSNSHRIKRDNRWNPPFTEHRFKHLSVESRRELKGEFFDSTGLKENVNLKLYRHAIGSPVRVPIETRQDLHEQSLSFEMESFPHPDIIAFNSIKIKIKDDISEDSSFEGPTYNHAIKSATRVQQPFTENKKSINELDFITLPEINRKYSVGNTLSKSNELKAEAMIKVEISNVETSASTSLITSSSQINVTIKENTAVDGGSVDGIETLDMVLEVYRFAEQHLKLPHKRFLEGLMPNPNVKLLDDGQTLSIYTTEIGTTTVYTDKGQIKIITLPGLKTRSKGITHI